MVHLTARLHVRPVLMVLDPPSGDVGAAHEDDVGSVLCVFEEVADGESRVTWEVEELPGEYCRLTLTHDRLEQAPKTAASIRGWSYYLSSLKSVLETGTALPPPVF